VRASALIRSITRTLARFWRAYSPWLARFKLFAYLSSKQPKKQAEMRLPPTPKIHRLVTKDIYPEKFPCGKLRTHLKAKNLGSRTRLAANAL